MTCTAQLRREGKAYPRTCPECGLGPCKVVQPLNGTQTHPLSDHAVRILKDLTCTDLLAFRINPGVINRLQRENLIEIYAAPSPLKTHKGKNTNWVRITKAGRDRLVPPFEDIMVPWGEP